MTIIARYAAINDLSLTDLLKSRYRMVRNNSTSMKNGLNLYLALEARLNVPVILVIRIPTPKRNIEGYSSQN